ncbi:FxsA family protein [Nocardioides sp. WS12]|uniref:FxsA family protein n=1 Tax=Nocardioides sp. WS12 TaxID=2486272 RepID=UPI0015F90460|nr:FxsA family protein [Nocardioides sp. WS12]
MVRRGGRRAALVLFLAFVVMPILEIFVLIQVGQAIGPWWTILLLVLDSIIGAWLIKREGRRAWQALQARLQTGQMPARELADGVLVVLGGAFMLSPGFVTDILGILLILPITRPLFRGLLTSYAVNRITIRTGPGTRTSPGTPPQGDVVRGEVVDPE